MPHLFNRRVVVVVIAGLAMLGAPGTAQAGAADVAFLQSYIGNYTGTGSIAGSQKAETVRCRLKVVPTADSNVLNYSGRCSVAGGSFSMSGALGFVNGRYQAAMSSSGGVAGTILGQKSQGGVSFSTQKRDASNGSDRTISSNLALTSGAINVDFNSVDNTTGKATSGQIAFARSH